MVSSNKSHSDGANPNSCQQSERHTRGGQPHQRDQEPAALSSGLRTSVQARPLLRASQPSPHPYERRSPFLPEAPFPLAVGVSPTAPSLSNSHNSLLFLAPRHRLLPGSLGRAAIKLAPPGLHLFHSPEATAQRG